jgi:hypothetical protein
MDGLEDQTAAVMMPSGGGLDRRRRVK